MNNYEKRLNSNSILSWIHSLRYKKVMQLIKSHPYKEINILEIGCANAKLFELLINEGLHINYWGIELDENFYQEAKTNYGKYSNFQIINASSANLIIYNSITQIPFDFIICLETLEHMSAKDANSTIECVRFLNPKFFLCSVPVELGLPILFKNLISFITGYDRHKNYSIKETIFALFGKFSEHKLDHKGFDYRQIRDYLKIRFSQVKSESIPFKFLPNWLANSIFFICK